MSQPLPPSAILVAHKVEDYDAWKKVFDSHAAARKEASALGHDVNRGIDDADMVYVYCPMGDVDKARAFVESPDLESVMRKAGVVGAPTVRIMKPVSADFIPDHMGVAMIVIHAVRDYDTWRKVYDEADGLRKRYGIIGHAVNQEWGRPNQVIVYHQAKDRDAMQKFVDSDELKKAMERAGVSGPPEIHFIQVCDIAEY